jgi:hypothetical protein
LTTITGRRRRVRLPRLPHIMNRRTLLRLALACLAILLLRPAMGGRVSGIEQFWIALTWASAVASCWGAAKAIRSFRWVAAEMVARPYLDWRAARISTINHLTTHSVLLLVQVDWLALGLWFGFQPPAPSASAGITAQQVFFTAVLIVSEVLLTILNFILGVNRQRLVDQVQRAGGD